MNKYDTLNHHISTPLFGDTGITSLSNWGPGAVVGIIL